MRILVDFAHATTDRRDVGYRDKRISREDPKHDGDEVGEFYSALPGQVLVGIEATGSMHWFLGLLEKLGIDHQVGHPSEIRKAETRKQKPRSAGCGAAVEVTNRPVRPA